MVAVDWLEAANREWAGLAADFSDYITTTARASRTARSYGFACRMFWRWCFQHETDPRDADRGSVRRWLAQRQREVTAGRAYSDLAALIAFYSFLRDRGDRADNPTDGITIKRPEVLPTQPLTRQELQLLVLACDNERDRMIIRTAAYSGLRISELASLCVDQESAVNAGDGYVDWSRGGFVFVGKGGDERFVVVRGELLAQMRSWLGLLPVPGRIFRSIYNRRPMSAHQIYKRLCFIGDKVGIDVHPHRFRATYACEWLETGGDIGALRHQMGHRSLQTTQRYQQATEARRAAAHMARFDLGL